MNKLPNYQHVFTNVIIEGFSLFDKHKYENKNDHLTILSFMKKNNQKKKEKELYLKIFVKYCLFYILNYINDYSRWK